MSDHFDIKVDIKEDLEKGLIFGLSARPPIAMILGFIDFQHEVLPILQTVSHETRAYTINADGLKSFIQEFEITKFIQSAEANGLLEDARKW